MYDSRGPEECCTTHVGAPFFQIEMSLIEGLQIIDEFPGMAELLALAKEKTPDSVEKIFEAATQERIVALDDDGAEALILALKQTLEDCALVNNAKVRRRVSRLISSIENRSSTTAAKLESRNTPSEMTAASSEEVHQKVKFDVSGMEAPDIVARLKAGVDNNGELEALLNALKIPPRDHTTGEHSEEFLLIRLSLKNALESLETSASDLTRSLQRRISRLKFSLLSTEEKEEEKRKASLKPKIAPPQPKGKRSEDSAEQLGDVDKHETPSPTSFIDVIASLKGADTSETVEAVIATINFSEVQCAISEEVKEMKLLLDEIIADESKSGNAKFRRRLGRMKESFDKISIAENKKGASDDEKSFSAILAAVQGAKDAKDVEASLTRLPSSIDYQDEDNVKDMDALEELLSGLSEDKEMVSTAPQRRKLKRALEAITKIRGGISSTEAGSKDMNVDGDGDGQEEGDVVLVYNPKPGPPLDGVIAAVRDASSAEELESAVNRVKPGHGNNKSRRTLKRALSTVMDGEEKEWIKELNSKARRSISRVLGMLEPVPDSGAKSVKRRDVLQDEDILSGVSKKDREEITKKARTEPPGPETGSSSTNPYILFIGQLSFGTQKVQLEKHLAASGVTDVKNIRILTDDSGNSRGMAFVELRNAEDMHKGLSTHHSVLHGRRLNVEKSCGGRNKQARQARITNFRDDQSKAVAEKIDAVIADFERREVITRTGLGDLLLNRLHSYSARQVGELLEDFEKRPKETRSLKVLDQICSALNEKLGRQNIDATENGGGERNIVE